MRFINTFESHDPNLGYGHILDDLNDILLDLGDEGYTTKSGVSRVWGSANNYDVFIDVKIDKGKDLIIFNRTDFDLLNVVISRLKEYMKGLGWTLVVDDLTDNGMNRINWDDIGLPRMANDRNRVKIFNQSPITTRWRKSHRG